VKVKDGQLILDMGDPLTGITWTANPGPDDYEIEIEAMKLDGDDFFCGLTFPVKDRCATLVVGGWGGSLIGISSLDGMDASENGTTQFRKIERNRWYRIRQRVTAQKLTMWLDDDHSSTNDRRPAGDDARRRNRNVPAARLRQLPHPGRHPQDGPAQALTRISLPNCPKGQAPPRVTRRFNAGYPTHQRTPTKLREALPHSHIAGRQPCFRKGPSAKSGYPQMEENGLPYGEAVFLSKKVAPQSCKTACAGRKNRGAVWKKWRRSLEKWRRSPRGTVFSRLAKSFYSLGKWLGSLAKRFWQDSKVAKYRQSAVAPKRHLLCWQGFSARRTSFTRNEP
jgi:hypothetical protein